MLFGNKNTEAQTDTFYDTDEPCQQTNFKNLVTKGQILYDSIYEMLRKEDLSWQNVD